MNIQDILAIGTPSKIINLLCVTPDAPNTAKAWQEYDGDHDILRDINRRDRVIGTGENRRLVKHAKEVITLQKKITETAVAFMFGEPAELTYGGDDADSKAFDAVKAAWTGNKLEYFNRRLMRSVCVESRAAELWHVYTKPDGSRELKVQLLREKDGYKLYPHFDDRGDMDGFAVEFSTEILGPTQRPVKVPNIWIYTANQIIRYSRQPNRHLWSEKVTPNPFEKIPIVYYEQDAPEWKDVETLIPKLEGRMSTHSDTNDYFGSPILILKGELIKAMPEKGDPGKVLALSPNETQDGKKEYGDIDYLTWDQSPESIRLEIDNLNKFIHSMTSTPDIAFENLKGIGNVAGISIKLMFLDAILKAKSKQEIYGEGFDRRINVIKAGLSAIDVNRKAALDNLDVRVTFGNPLPENILELVEMLSTSRAGEALVSRETAAANNPMVMDAAQEVERLEQEAEENSRRSAIGIPM